MSHVSSVGLFPFCVKEVTDPSILGPDAPYPAQYPFAFTLQECLDLYWKYDYRSTAFQFDIPFSCDLTYCDSSFQYEFDGGAAPAYSITNEKQLVCNQAPISSGLNGSQSHTFYCPYIVDPDGNEIPIGANASYFAQFFLFYPTAPSSVVKYGDLYYPFFSFYAEFASNFGANIQYLVYMNSYDSSVPSYPYTSSPYTISFAGKTMTRYASVYTQDEGSGSSATGTLPSEITMAVPNRWPYSD